MPASTHGPSRTCIGCRRVRPAAEMVRVAITDGVPRLGPGPGRGAWLCGRQCLTAAVRRKAFARAWRRPVEPGTIERLDELLTWAMQVEAHPGTLSGGVTNERRSTKG